MFQKGKIIKFTDVKEVKETSDYREVNSLVKNDWILLQIVPNQEMLFVIGRLGD